MQLKLLILALLLLVAVPAIAQDDMAATIDRGGNDDLGEFLVGSNGMTLYIFANDEPGVSNCYDQCAVNWPPLLVEDEEMPTLADGIPGRVATIEREDGGQQVVFNDQPLYYWVNDAEPGDATGHEVNNVWFVATVPDIGLGGNEDLGEFLVGSNGMTLYVFANDEPGTSNCYDQCAENWPPLLVEDEMMPSVQSGLVGEYGVTERDDGTFQATYDEMPLYFWVNDAEPGDATGHNVGEVWFVAKLPTVAVDSSDELGEYLVGSNGMTLYMFANDEPGTSNCYDQCAVNWPPLLVADDEEPTAADGIMGELGVTERDDGTFQVTYNDVPLYYWINDVVPGDTTGHNVGDVWFVVAP